MFATLFFYLNSLSRWERVFDRIGGSGINSVVCGATGDRDGVRLCVLRDAAGAKKAEDESREEVFASHVVLLRVL
jgi:hypothetical protein